jgi:hypothetical protein
MGAYSFFLSLYGPLAIREFGFEWVFVSGLLLLVVGRMACIVVCISVLHPFLTFLAALRACPLPWCGDYTNPP